MSDIGLRNVTTPRLGLNQPDVGGDIDVWGDLLNGNATILDQALLVGQAAAAYLALAGGTMTGQVLNQAGTAGAPSFATSTSSGMYPIGANVGISAFGSLLFMFGLSANISYVTLNMNNNRITGLAMPTTLSDAVNVQYLQSYPALLTTGGTMTGALTLAADGAAAMQPVTVQQFNAMVALMAPLASPGFTGTPTAPTASPGTNTAQLATTAFVEAAITGSVAGVSSFNTRTGAVTLALADVTGAGGAPLASPAFTGAPSAPTATAGTNTMQLANTAFVTGAVAAETANVVSNPNAIDNSGFGINQRGYTSGAALAAGAIGFDRWKAGASGCTLTFAALSAATVVTITAGSLQQVVEGGGLVTGGYTLSWTGTAQGRVGAGPYAASPLAVTATANTNLTVEFNTGTLSRVKLELGINATAWQPLAPQQDQARCQRFYQVISVSSRSWATQASQIIESSVAYRSMRVAPTSTPNGAGTSNNISAALLTIISNNSGRFGVTAVAAGDAYGLGYGYNLTADL